MASSGRSTSLSPSAERPGNLALGRKTSRASADSRNRRRGGLGLSELRELRQLREENGKLKRLVADLSLDRHILQEIVQKSCKAIFAMCR
jgi:hypothetical protein